VPLALPRWPAALSGLRVALFSDLHAAAGPMSRRRIAELVDCALGLDADLYLLLGDYLDSTRLGDGRARVREVARELARLPDPLAVLGNHDWRAAGPAMGWALRDAGVRVLENEAVRVRDGLWVAGIACTRHRYADAEATLREVPDDAAAIVAVHDPDHFPNVPARAALTVAGHLHGGQVNIPVLRRPFLPTRYGDRFLAGHIIEEGRHLYVGTGLGVAGLPLRLRRPPELPVLRIVPAASGM
jgi:predicted MPP superfamily phosphohydrolase